MDLIQFTTGIYFFFLSKPIMHYYLRTIISKAYSRQVEDERALLYASKLWRDPGGHSSSYEKQTQRRKPDSNFIIALNLNVVFKSDSVHSKKYYCLCSFSCTYDDQNGRKLLCFSSLFNIKKNQN